MKEQKFEETTKQEDMGNKLSEKLQFPLKDLNDLREKSSKFLSVSTTESNQTHLKPAAENESHDEGQKTTANFRNFSRNKGLQKFKWISLVVIL